MAALYGPIEATAVPAEDIDVGIEDVEQDAQGNEQEYEFRLFSTNADSSHEANHNPTVHKILLEDENAEELWNTEGRFLHPRPRSYYFHDASNEDLKRQFAIAALSGDDVLSMKRSRHWGLEVPWRVKVLKVHTSTKLITGHKLEVQVAEDEADRKSKTKPNKKRRIILRERARVKAAKEEERRKLDTEKEEREREKRTRRNREKKVKRKLKEKAKKAEAGGATENGGAGEAEEKMEGIEVGATDSDGD